MKTKNLFNGVKYFTVNYVLPVLLLCMIIISCNELPNKEDKVIELKASSFKAPIVDTIAVVPDSNAYILNNK